jgi:uncharacterized integral membrane protein
MSENSAIELQDSRLPRGVPDAPPMQTPGSAPQRTSVPSPGPSAPLQELEPRGARFARHAHRVRLYLYAFLGVALLVYCVALASSNTHRVRVDWVFGRSSVSLVWLVLLAVILGWMLGLLAAVAFRWRTRAPRPS